MARLHLCGAEHGRLDDGHHAVEGRHAADGAALHVQRQAAVAQIRLFLRRCSTLHARYARNK